ncbi:MAG: GNAT family N-acetyltransferase [Clostridia bacterium]
MLIIRELEPNDDFNAVGHIYAESWKASYRGIVPQAYLDKLNHNRWSAMLRADPAQSLGAFLDGTLVGTAMVSFARDAEREGYGEIVSIYLLPAYTGRGYGKELMQACLEKLSQDGCADICLWVIEQNQQAKSFYQRMGFHSTGRTQAESFGGKELQLMEFCMHRADDHSAL